MERPLYSAGTAHPGIKKYRSHKFYYRPAWLLKLSKPRFTKQTQDLFNWDDLKKLETNTQMLHYLDFRQPLITKNLLSQNNEIQNAGAKGGRVSHGVDILYCICALVLFLPLRGFGQLILLHLHGVPLRISAFPWYTYGWICTENLRSVVYQLLTEWLIWVLIKIHCMLTWIQE